MVDPEKIRRLVEMMSEFELTEISLRDGEEEIRLTRPGHTPEGVVAGTGPCGHVTLPAPVMAHPAAAPGSQPTVPPTVEQSPPTPAENLPSIKSPMVGTLYLASDPQTPAFVSVGSRVTSATVVCIIEAMKVFNEIKAEVAGTVTEVLVKNEDPVEFGQPMFVVRPD